MKKVTGRHGEKISADYLEKKGYRILERNYLSRYGEIDIIAADDNNIIFVEVKTRVCSPMVTGAESVTSSKQQRVSATASIYLQQNPTELQPRFDVIAVEYSKDTFEVTDHIENAF